MGAKDSGNDEGKDGKHVEHGVGSNGGDGDGSGDMVVVNDSNPFICKP